MKLRFSVFASFIIILITLFFLFFYRSIPVTQIWKNYSVLYIENSVPEQAVMSYLEEEGCKNVISISSQQVPINNRYAPVSQEFGSYLSRRLLYFTDESSRYSLYYIPEAYQLQARKAIARLQREFFVDLGMDGKETYPWFVPMVCLCVFLLLAFLSRKRLFFVLPGIFPVLLSISLPFYTVASGVCLFLLGLFIINNILGRKKVLLAIFTNPYAVILSVSPLLIFSLVSLPCAMLGSLTMLSSALCIFMISVIKNYIDSRNKFSFVTIFSAKQIPIMFKRTARVTLFIVVPIAILFFLFVFNSLGKANVFVKGVSIPVPIQNDLNVEENYNTVSLPTIEDYFEWAWNVIVFPYRSLNEPFDYAVKEGDSVSVSQYTMDNKGINTSKAILYTYNEDFRSSLEKNIKDASFPTLEKFLIAQGRMLHVGYSGNNMSTGNNTEKHDMFSLILLIIALCEPAFMYTSYYILGRKK